MNVVMIVPTGIGCEIGGHSGDATPAARLLGATCDNLLLHPNVVNASDLNEMPENAWYVEGSILDSFLMGVYHLSPPRHNKVLAIVNNLDPLVVNSLNAARAILGTNIEMEVLETPIEMIAAYNEDGTAGGTQSGVDEASIQIRNKVKEYDAVAVLTPITMDAEVAYAYFSSGGVNPYGKVEANVSRELSAQLKMPVAHAPLELKPDKRLDTLIVDPRIASEMIGGHMFSVLKGLAKAPRISYGSPGDLYVNDIDCMVSPMCWGHPHECCEGHEIPVIYVEENATIYDWKPEPHHIVAKTYYEAAGMILAMKNGIKRIKATGIEL